MWFLFDISFVSIAIIHAYPAQRRGVVVARTVGIVVAGIVFLDWLSRKYPDDREQITAFWTGVVLQLPISVGSVWLLLQRRDTKGHSLEIW